MSQTKITLTANEWRLISRPRVGRQVFVLPVPAAPALYLDVNTAPDLNDAYQLGVVSGAPIGYVGTPVIAADTDEIWVLSGVAASVVVVEI